MIPYFSLLPAAFLIVYMIMYVAILAIAIISLWKIYEKMGEPGWKGIIPYYNIWVMVDKLKKPRFWFWIQVVCSALLIGISVITTGLLLIAMQTQEDIAGIIAVIGIFSLIIAVVALVYQIRLFHALSKSFGYGAGFTVGLVLLPIVFFPILAFGDSVFTSPADIQPIVYTQTSEPENITGANDEAETESENG